MTATKVDEEPLKTTLTSINYQKHQQCKQQVQTSQQQQQQQQKNPKLYKTELCRSWMDNNGHCNYGQRCQYAHGEKEKRPVPRHPKYKTEACVQYHNTGYCPYGSRCHFIHNEMDSTNNNNCNSVSGGVGTNRMPGLIPIPAISDGLNVAVQCSPTAANPNGLIVGRQIETVETSSAAPIASQPQSQQQQQLPSLPSFCAQEKLQRHSQLQPLSSLTNILSLFNASSMMTNIIQNQSSFSKAGVPSFPNTVVGCHAEKTAATAPSTYFSGSLQTTTAVSPASINRRHFSAANLLFPTSEPSSFSVYNAGNDGNSHHHNQKPQQTVQRAQSLVTATATSMIPTVGTSPRVNQHSFKMPLPNKQNFNPSSPKSQQPSVSDSINTNDSSSFDQHGFMSSGSQKDHQTTLLRSASAMAGNLYNAFHGTPMENNTINESEQSSNFGAQTSPSQLLFTLGGAGLASCNSSERNNSPVDGDSSGNSSTKQQSPTQKTPPSTSLLDSITYTSSNPKVTSTVSTTASSMSELMASISSSSSAATSTSLTESLPAHILFSSLSLMNHLSDVCVGGRGIGSGMDRIVDYHLGHHQRHRNMMQPLQQPQHQKIGQQSLTGHDMCY